MTIYMSSLFSFRKNYLVYIQKTMRWNNHENVVHACAQVRLFFSNSRASITYIFIYLANAYSTFTEEQKSKYVVVTW